jgi:hypothetical protein
MQARSRSLLVLGGTIVLGTLAFVVLRDDTSAAKRSKTTASASNVPNRVEPAGVEASMRRNPVPGARPVSATPSASPRLALSDSTEEGEYMAMLRDVGLQDPELSLHLAREGNARFPGSSDGAERGWYEVRALVDLKRTDEAVAVSRALVDKYPNSPFALDVARHMLTHPMRDPGQVDYAKGP